MVQARRKKLKLRIGLDYQSPIEIPVVDNLVLVDSLDSAVGIEYRENFFGRVAGLARCFRTFL